MRIILWAFFLLFSATAPAYQLQLNTDIALTGDAAFVSKYVVRGVNASDGPVVQASVTAMHADSGCYGKLWGTQLDFGHGDPTNGEVDITLGCGGSNEDGVTWDLNLTHYVFVGAPKSYQYDFTEVVMSLSRDFRYVTVGGEAAITYDYFGAGKEAMYWRVIATVPLGDKWTVFGHYGKQSVNYSVNTISYAEQAIGLTYQPNTRLSWEVRLKDSDKDCKACGSEVVGKVRIAF